MLGFYSAMAVLVVDDDLAARKTLSFLLEKLGGHTVEEAADGQEALRRLARGGIELVVLDVAMPEMDGFEVCRRVRGFSNVPILLVSAMGGVQERVRGLQLGADDYLPRPYEPSELLARVNALLRRANRVPSLDSTVLRAGPLLLDLVHRTVRVGRKPPVNLAPAEFRLLLDLATHVGQVRTRADLQAALWGDAGVQTAAYSTVSAYIAGLRAKLEANADQPQYIRTIRGKGYVLLV